MGLKGTPAFMSFNVLIKTGHVHSLEDDLESFIYVVLYAALRWLPVESGISLRWWMTSFFGAPNPSVAVAVGGALPKLGSAIWRNPTSTLHSTTSSHVVDWLKAAMELHYKDAVANPQWNGGKELRKMWEEVLAAELPSNDRVVNLVPGMKFRGDGFLHATHTSATSMQDLYRSRDASTPPPEPAPLKRLHTYSADDSVLPPAPKPSKRSRKGQQPQTRSTSMGDDDMMTGLASATISLGGTNALSSEGSTDTL